MFLLKEHRIIHQMYYTMYIEVFFKYEKYTAFLGTKVLQVELLKKSSRESANVFLHLWNVFKHQHLGEVSFLQKK
jgi:hypothetical protein